MLWLFRCTAFVAFEKAPRLMSKFQAYAVLIVCNLMGGLGLLCGAQAFLEARVTQRGPSVEGRVTSIGVVGDYTDTVQSYRVFRVEVEYAYTVDGQHYRGDRLTLPSPSQSAAEAATDAAAQEIAKKYPVGQVVRVHYAPDDPSQAILEPSSSLGMLVLAIAGVLTMVLSTAFVIAVAGQELLPRTIWLLLRMKLADRSTSGSS